MTYSWTTWLSSTSAVSPFRCAICLARSESFTFLYVLVSVPLVRPCPLSSTATRGAPALSSAARYGRSVEGPPYDRAGERYRSRGAPDWTVHGGASRAPLERSRFCAYRCRIVPAEHEGDLALPPLPVR